MSLPDYPALDVATLRAVACELRSSLLDQVSAAADAARATARSSIGPRLDDASLDALAQLQDFAVEVSEAIAAIGREATRREETSAVEQDRRQPTPIAQVAARYSAGNAAEARDGRVAESCDESGNRRASWEGRTNTALPQTRRVSHRPPPIGPMPPRWERWGRDSYRHESGAVVYVVGETARTAGDGTLAGLELVLRDAADLVAWMRRGGR